MEKFDSELEKQFYERLVNALGSNSELILKPLDKWKTSLLLRTFDLVVYKGINPLAVVEVKGRISTSKDRMAVATDQVRSALTITNARFGIVTDNEQFLLYDRNNHEQDFKEVQFDAIVGALRNPSKVRVQKKDKELVASIITSAIHKIFPKRPELIEHMSLRQLSINIEFDEDTHCYRFIEKQNLNSFENKFFQVLFGELTESIVCRYTSLSTVFAMLNNLSFRMSGLVGMNDKSEVNYVDTYLDGVEKPLAKLHPRSISAINNRYISSCASKMVEDNLTLWRLYGDDSKGVCLVFDIIDKNLNANILLQRVKYADESGTHAELELLRLIRTEIDRQTGFMFEFRKLAYWKHFFKPFEYSIEDEIRLLVIDDDSIPKIKNDWVMTYSHSIINPTMDFKLNSTVFPIQLRKIILGPKCPEQELNKVQIEEMIRRRNIGIKKKDDVDIANLTVELSEIKHYR